MSGANCNGCRFRFEVEVARSSEVVNKSRQRIDVEEWTELHVECRRFPMVYVETVDDASEWAFAPAIDRCGEYVSHAFEFKNGN